MKNAIRLIAFASLLLTSASASAQTQARPSNPGSAVATTGDTPSATPDYRLVAGDKLR